MGGVKLAKNNEEYLLLELLPSVANGFLRKRRSEEYAAEAAKNAPAVEDKAEKAAEDPITGPTLVAPMPGKIVEINVKAGDKVSKGQVILVYEAMKMENDITAEKEAVVKRIFVQPGDNVGNDAVLVEFEG